MCPNIINFTLQVILKLILLYNTKPGDRQDCEKCEKLPFSTAQLAPHSPPSRLGAAE